jgi:pseudouridine kinase
MVLAHLLSRPHGGDGRAVVGCGNIARNLARLGVPTALFTVVGQDEFGDRILREARAAGIDTSMTLLSGKPTGTYVALLDRDGDLTAAISAMDAMEELTAQRIGARAAALAQARMVVADCNLEQAALLRLAELCAGAKVAVGGRCRVHAQGRAAATAPEGRLPIHLLALNRDEAAILAGGRVQSDADLKRAAGALHRMNVQHVLIGLSDRGTLRLERRRRRDAGAPVPRRAERCDGRWRCRAGRRDLRPARSANRWRRRRAGARPPRR